MSDTNKRWRCPYCDGLNDWQNTVCEICGDGHRPKAEVPAKEPEIPKTYTPRERKSETEAPRYEPVKETRTAYAPPPPPAPEPKKKKKGGVLIAIVIVALAALGGRFLGDSFVRSVEENKPTATPLSVIETPVPTDAPADVHAPAGEQEAQVQAADATQTRAGASIESIVDNGDGTVSVYLKQGELSFENYMVYYTIVPNGEPYVHFDNMTEDWFSLPIGQSSRHKDDPVDTPRTLEIVPEQNLQFYVRSYNGYDSGKWWKAEQLYNFPQSKAQLPLQLQDAQLCTWESYDDFKAYRQSLYDVNGKPASALPNPPVYSFTSAQDLFDVMSRYSPIPDKPGEICDSLVVTFRLGIDRQAYYDWKQIDDRIDVMLSGPGFAIKGQDNASAMAYVGSNTCIRAVGGTTVFQDAYKYVRRTGVFPEGEYTLSFYYNGTSVGSTSFTLAGKGGATSAAQAASAPASAVFPLKKGSKGNEVKYLQQALMVLSPGFEGPADGIFGAKTQEAVYLLQDIAGYDHTGTVDLEQYRDFTVSAGVLPESAFQ